MDIYEACKQVALDCRNRSYCDSGLFVEVFYMNLQEGETPKMALTLARRGMTKYMDTKIMDYDNELG